MRYYCMFALLLPLFASPISSAQTEATPTEITADELAPTDLNQQGLEAYNRGDFESAISFFKQVHALVPDNTTVSRNLVNSYQSHADHLAKSGKLDQAMDFVDAALTLEPENISPIIQSGAYNLRQNHVAKAIDILENAIKLAPGTLEAHQLLGEAYYRDNDIPSARVQWDYVLEMDPSRTELRERYEKAFREEAVEGDFNKAGSRHFNISYPDGVDYRYRTWILTTLERAYMDIGRNFGGVYPPAPLQVIVYDAEQFNEATQLASHIGGLFDGKIRIPLTTESGEFLSDDELKRRLNHEYVHVVVRQIINTQHVPWWLNEGLAENFSRESNSDFEETLSTIYHTEEALSLQMLEGSQLYSLNPEKLRHAYLQAHAAIEYLWAAHGKYKMIRLLKDINSGTPPEEALNTIFHMSYSDLDAQLKRTYAR